MSRGLTVDGQGGVNLLSDPTAVADNEFVDARNLFPLRPGTFGTRKAMDFFQPLVWGKRADVSPIAQYFVTGSGDLLGYKAMALSTVPGVDWIVVVAAASTFSSQPAGDQLLVCGPGLSEGGLLGEFLLHARGSNPYCLVNFGQRTLIFDGTSQGWVVQLRRDADASRPMTGGTAPTDIVIQELRLVGLQDSPLTPSFAAVRHDRLVLGDPRPGFESTLVWCDTVGLAVPGNSNADAWRTVGDDAVNSRGFLMGTDAEGGITALWSAATMPQAASPEAALYVFKKDALYIFTGHPGQSTDLLPDTINRNAQVTRLNINAGCIAPNTLTWTPQGLLWVGSDDIWVMNLGSLPSRCGTKIRPVLEAQPPALQHRLHAAYHDGCYKLAVYEDGQGPTENSPCHEQWWLDLRGGETPNVSSARWWGPQHYGGVQAMDTGTYALVVENRPNRDRVMMSPQLAVVPNAAYAGSVSQQPGLIPVVVSFEKQSNKDRILPQGEWREWIAETAYDAGDIVRPRLFSGLEFIVQVSGTSDVSQPDWTLLTDGAPTLVDGTVSWIGRTYVSGGGVPQTYIPPELDTGDILIDLTSKEYSAPSAKVEKLLDGMDVVFQASTPLTVDVSLFPDAQTNQISKSFLQGPPRLGVNALPVTFGQKWDKRFLPPLPNQRSRASTYQVRVAQNGSFIVPNEFAIFQYRLFDDAVGSAAFPFGAVSNMVHKYGLIGNNFGDPDAPPHILESPQAAADALLSSISANRGIHGLFPLIVDGDYFSGRGITIMSTDGAMGFRMDWLDLGDPYDGFVAAANSFWISLLGYAGLAVDNLISFPDGTPVSGPASPPKSEPAILLFKEIGPRIRVFKRQPT